MFGLRFEFHHYFHFDTVLDVKSVQDLLRATLLKGDQIMSAISDFAAKQQAHNAAMDAAVDGIVADVGELKRLITELQNSAGKISAEDQATLDSLEAKAAALEAKVTDLDNQTPPAVPPTP